MQVKNKYKPLQYTSFTDNIKHSLNQTLRKKELIKIAIENQVISYLLC